MKHSRLTGGKARLFAGAGVAALSLAAFATPAFAQDQAAADCVDADGNGVCDADEADNAVIESSAIVVTGTRISRPTLSSPTPITSVTPEELTNTGDISLGDALNDLPSLRSTFSQGNSTRFIGTAGLNLLDLRGLGTSRTLVLVNGKRHITASPGDYLVDINTIPVDLLERVDVVTGGNSAVYGSDAVAGVVNFILKRDFDGLSIKGQAGISERGDRATRFLSGVYGKNFADGRGNVSVAAEWAKTDPLYFNERDELTGAYSGRCQFNNVEGGPLYNGFDNEPVCGIRNRSVSDGGTIGGLGDGDALIFTPDGDLVIDNGGYIGPFTGNVIGGNGSTLRNTGQLAAGLERYTLNLLARYDVSDAFRPFVEAKYVHIDAIQEGQPSFFVGGPGFVGGPDMRCDNGFLSAQALGVLQGFGLCTDPATGTFPLSRFNVDFGGRGELHDRDTYRIVGGVEGTFNDDWNYEVSLNYGRLETEMRSLNNLLLFDIDGNPTGFNVAIDAVDDGTGNIVCRINVDADPTNDDPACVPINVFGYGAPSKEALEYVNTTALRQEQAEQFVALASVSGDLSQVFELPGGPVAFALGAEYREEKAYSAFDDLTASGGTFLNAIQPFDPPKLTVKEAFGELSLPILANMPFAEELTISGAARVSDYNSATGTVWAYNIQGIYAPVPDIRFRAAYATSVRAPTQSDLYSPASQNFAFISDPCDQQNIGNNPNRADNCAAAGVPTTANAALVAACDGTSFPLALGDPFLNCTARTSSTSFTQGGNPTLTEEKGKSLTLGVVVEPRFIPGLNFTVDYYNIEIEDQIAVLGAQTIINNCYDAPQGIDNPYCATVQRDPTTGLFDPDVAVIAGGINFASRKTEGIDFDLAYRRTFDNGHRLSFRAIATHLLTLNFFEDPTSPVNPNRIKSELGDPDWAASANFNYDFGEFDITWSMRFLDSMYKSAYENSNPYTGICPSSGSTGSSGGTCTPGELTTLDPANPDQFEKHTFSWRTYHNIRLNYELPGNDFNFFIGVDNLFDKQPPFGQLGTAGGDPYDTFGRYYYAGFTLDL
ncbi:TonB-dependent receptor domain-containing protein [Pelagerythrobacter marinus]|uniref:TonB-dependent receptor domain-containing protein n=1 Tax=Pelagerythrobacter marinus TaxID=538382 RepID=UPI002036801A|nr:TonB-dependent receptor [Pelagerythrobacter marinus]USA39942.1 TonB-dependent receptor [Pelagerythrobacter marinus]WPZ05939.1 TonB-dependent receptor [Pelagerythrobacter marinus]